MRLYSLISIWFTVGVASAFTAAPLRRQTSGIAFPQVRVHDTYSTLVLNARPRGSAVRRSSSKNGNSIVDCLRNALCCLKPALVSKWLGSVEALAGFACLGFTDETTDFFGLNSSRATRLYVKAKGILSMGAGITALGTIVKGMSLTKSFGYALIPMLVGMVMADASGDVSEEFDVPKNLMLVGTAAVAGAVYGCLTGATWAGKVTKLFGIGMTLEGLAVTFIPNAYYELFGISTMHLSNQAKLFASKLCGITEVHFGVLVWLLTRGMPGTRALGFSMIPYILMAWSALYSGAADDLGLNKNAIGAAGVVVPIATAALLI